MNAEKRLAELSLPPKAREAFERGELWRTKEILLGRLGSMPFSSEAFEQVGLVLLLMGDDLEAGRYLFASGLRRTEYASSIDLFLARHGRKSAYELVAALPQKVKWRPFAELPAEVAEALTRLGFPTRETQAPIAKAVIKPLKSRAKDKLKNYGCAVLAIFGLICMLLGFSAVVAAVASLFQR